MNKKVLIIIIAIVAVAAGAAVYFLVFAGGGGGGETEKLPVYEYYTPFEYITVNPKDSYGFVKVAPVLVLSGPKITATLEKELPRVRDAIVFILREYTREELIGQNTHISIKQQITDTLNEMLKTDMIVEVLFTEYVIQ